MPQTAQLTLDAMLRIPADALLDVSSVTQRLRFKNPAWDTATHYARRDMKEWWLFYQQDKIRRELAVPRNFPLEGVIKGGWTQTRDDRCAGQEGASIELGEAVALRPYQLAFYEDHICRAWDEGVTDIHLNMPCGHGKTLMALYMAAVYKRRTLVLVTTHALAQQFKAAAAWITPGASCGVMEPGKKWQDWDITIATYSLLSDAVKFPAAWYALFGHLVCDEWHKTGAGTYYPILERAGCLYRTMLSATLRRRDGLAEVLKYHVACTLTMRRQTPGATVLPLLTGAWLDLEALKNVAKRQLPWKKLDFGETVEVHDATRQYRGLLVEVTESAVTVQDSQTRKQQVYRVGEAKFFEVGDLSFARLDSAICEHPERLALTQRVVRELVGRERTTLVLARRTQILYDLSLAQRTTEPAVKQGVVISQKRPEQVAWCKNLATTPTAHEAFCTQEAEVTYGINKLAEEGYDNERLDTLVLLHPLKDIEQAAGRILRVKAGKKPALIIYFVDNVRPYAGAWKEARKMFAELGHTVLAPQTWEDFLKRYGS